MFRLIGSFHFETSPKGRFCPSGYIIHIGFIPFTDFTFFNQIPYPSVIQGEGTSCFSGYCAHRPYARCLRPVCSVFTIRMLGAHRMYARYLGDICTEIGNQQRPFTLYRRWTKQWSKKGKAGERGKNRQKRYPEE